MTKQELLDTINALPCKPDDQVAISIWDSQLLATVDLEFTGCTPTGADNVLRIGVKRPLF